MKRTILLLTITLAIACGASAQSPKAAEQKSRPAATNAPSNVDGKFTVLSSHIKSIGTIGKTGRYEIVSARLRGLDSPNISALLAYDSETDSLGVLASGVEPGLGVAIVNGGASVGSSYLFGSKLRPDRTSVNNNSESEGSSAKSTSEGGDAVSVSEGGDAVSISKSDSDASATSRSSSTATARNSNSIRNSNSNSNTSVNSNVNANSNQQTQGQGQVQGQSNNNNNHNHNKAPKAPKKKSPKKSKKH